LCFYAPIIIIQITGYTPAFDHLTAYVSHIVANAAEREGYDSPSTQHENRRKTGRSSHNLSAS